MSQATRCAALIIAVWATSAASADIVGTDLQAPGKNVSSVSANNWNDTVWVGTTSGVWGVKADGKPKFKVILTGDPYVSAIASDKDQGGVWLATYNGVFRYAVDGRLLGKISNVSASAVAVDQQNAAVWTGTLNQGLLKIRIPTMTIERFGVDQGLPSNVVYSVLPSGKTTVWVGTDRGLVRFDGTKWESVPELSGRSVLSLAEDAGRIVAGTDDGAFVLAGAQQQWERVPQSAGKVITSATVAGEKLFLGTRDSGVLYYKDLRGTAFPTTLSMKQLGFPERPVSSLSASAQSEAVVVGTFGGGVRQFPFASFEK